MDPCSSGYRSHVGKNEDLHHYALGALRPTSWGPWLEKSGNTYHWSRNKVILGFYGDKRKENGNDYDRSYRV